MYNRSHDALNSGIFYFSSIQNGQNLLSSAPLWLNSDPQQELDYIASSTA